MIFTRLFVFMFLFLLCFNYILICGHFYGLWMISIKTLSLKKAFIPFYGFYLLINNEKPSKKS